VTLTTLHNPSCVKCRATVFKNCPTAQKRSTTIVKLAGLIRFSTGNVIQQGTGRKHWRATLRCLPCPPPHQAEHTLPIGWPTQCSMYCDTKALVHFTGQRQVRSAVSITAQTDRRTERRRMDWITNQYGTAQRKQRRNQRIEPVQFINVVQSKIPADAAVLDCTAPCCSWLNCAYLICL